MSRRRGEFGIGIANITVDFDAVINRARRTAQTSRTYLDHSFANTK